MGASHNRGSSRRSLIAALLFFIISMLFVATSRPAGAGSPGQAVGRGEAPHRAFPLNP